MAAPPLCRLQSSGRLSEEAQAEVLEGRAAELAGCLEADPDAEPVVVAAVSRDGVVGLVRSADDEEYGNEARCIARIVRTLRFPPPSCELPAKLAWRFRAYGKPEVVHGGGACDGPAGLSDAAIAEVLEENADDPRGCYERALRRNPSLRGSVEASFLIDADGRVSWVGLREELADREVGRCIVGALRTWRFPMPGCGELVTAKHAWSFEPHER